MQQVSVVFCAVVYSASWKYATVRDKSVKWISYSYYLSHNTITSKLFQYSVLSLLFQYVNAHSTT